MRKTLVVLAATLALGAASATGALARHGGGRPVGTGGDHPGEEHFGEFGEFGPGLGVYGYDGIYIHDECLVTRRVWGPYGWYLQHVWICW